MSDFSIDQYGDKDKDKNAENPFGGALTKAQHRNPDIHVVGDNLPPNLVNYNEGSATLAPDVAGNTPVMMRQRFTINGNQAVNQNLTTVTTQLANFSQAVTCPLEASGSPFVIVSAAWTMYATTTGGGVTNYCWSDLQSNGVFAAPARAFWQREYAVGTELIPWVISPFKIGINPGQTLTLRAMGTQISPAGFKQQYSASILTDRSYFNVELYY